MKTLTNENDLIIENDCILYFYTNNQIVNYLMNKVIKEIDQIKNLTCINLLNFNLHKRFNIKEVPTFIIYENGKEINRKTGILTSKEVL